MMTFESAYPGTSTTHPKLSRPEKPHCAGCFLNCSRSWLTRRPLALDVQIHFLPDEKFLHSVRQEILHRTITGEEDKGASVRVGDKTRDHSARAALYASSSRVRASCGHDEEISSAFWKFDGLPSCNGSAYTAPDRRRK
jgi:hypothetical protein